MYSIERWVAIMLGSLAFATRALSYNYSSNEILSIMHWVNYYDNGYSIPQKQWDTTLFDNAQKTGQLNNGVTENHYLFPGSYAQVICPGKGLKQTKGRSYAPFENFQAAYLDWLCERPNSPALQGDCAKALQVSCIYETPGVTGHNDILTSTSYTKIGCSFTANPNASVDACDRGIWVCDLA